MESVLLWPRAAFHLGERGIGLEETSLILHSDTLFAALCAVWIMLYGEEALSKDLLPPDPEEEDWLPPFLLSSAFPFIGSVRFYPRPLVGGLAEEEPGGSETEQRQLARLKDVELVSEAIFMSLLAGKHLLPQPEDELLHDGMVWVSAQEAAQLRKEFGVRTLEGEQFWSMAKVPRVALDVQTSASSIWHFGRVNFRTGGWKNLQARAGYHFLVRYVDQNFAGRVKAAVRLLGDVGIGGDRSTGHGLFEPVFTVSPAFPVFPDARAFVTLSLLFPKSEQVSILLGESCRYRLVTRGGWIGGLLATPLRRKTVRMFAEGSLLTGSIEHRSWGKAVDVTPQDAGSLGLAHHVYRFGFAFPVGVRV